MSRRGEGGGVVTLSTRSDQAQRRSTSAGRGGHQLRVRRAIPRNPLAAVLDGQQDSRTPGQAPRPAAAKNTFVSHRHSVPRREDCTMGSTKDVLDKHLNSFREGNLRAHPVRLCAGRHSVHARRATHRRGDPSILQGAARGVRKTWRRLQSGEQFVDGDYRYILWTAETADQRYELGTDTFVVLNGKGNRGSVVRRKDGAAELTAHRTSPPAYLPDRRPHLPTLRRHPPGGGRGAPLRHRPGHPRAPPPSLQAPPPRPGHLSTPATRCLLGPTRPPCSARWPVPRWSCAGARMAGAHRRSMRSWRR